MRALLLLAPMLLAGCQESKFEQAKERVTFLQRNMAPRGEVCAAKRSVAQAAIEEQRGDEYQLARIDAELECSRVR